LTNALLDATEWGDPAQLNGNLQWFPPIRLRIATRGVFLTDTPVIVMS
jgi:hypothetical protein